MRKQERLSRAPQYGATTLPRLEESVATVWGPTGGPLVPLAVAHSLAVELHVKLGVLRRLGLNEDVVLDHLVARQEYLNRLREKPEDHEVGHGCGPAWQPLVRARNSNLDRV